MRSIEIEGEDIMAKIWQILAVCVVSGCLLFVLFIILIEFTFTADASVYFCLSNVAKHSFKEWHKQICVLIEWTSKLRSYYYKNLDLKKFIIQFFFKQNEWPGIASNFIIYEMVTEWHFSMNFDRVTIYAHWTEYRENI